MANIKIHVFHTSEVCVSPLITWSLLPTTIRIFSPM